MKGNVIGFDSDTNTGAISGHDGKRYDFATQDWHSHTTPRHGDLVDFSSDGQRATQIYVLDAEYTAPSFGQFLFSPNGRISRKQYWLKWTLPVLVIYLVLWGIMVGAAVSGNLAVVGVFAIIQGLFMLLTLWPNIAVLVKRIHDRNKSGWLALLLYVPLVISYIITFTLGQQSPANAVIGLVLLGVGIWFFIEFGCMRGTIGANAYGPDPVPHQ
jgi:uncharacterized membrane protein YhaH (DUF805 family)